MAREIFFAVGNLKRGNPFVCARHKSCFFRFPLGHAPMRRSCMYDGENEVAEEILHDMGIQDGESEGEGSESEVDLASELLDVSTEAELDRFFGKLVSGAGRFLK